MCLSTGEGVVQRKPPPRKSLLFRGKVLLSGSGCGRGKRAKASEATPAQGRLFLRPMKRSSLVSYRTEAES